MAPGNQWCTCADGVPTGDGADLNDRSSLDSWMVNTDVDLLLLGVDSSSPFGAFESDVDVLQQQLLPSPPAIEYQADIVPLHQLVARWSDDDRQLTDCAETRFATGDLGPQLLASSVAGVEGSPGAAKRPWTISESVRAVVPRQPRAGAKAKYASTRERRKSEIQALQEEATELEKRVKRIRETTLSQVWQESTSAIVNPPPGSVHAMVFPLQPTWRHVAERHSELLRKSVQENKSLKKTVVDETKLVRNLQRMLKRRVVQVATMRNAITSEPEWSHLGRSPDDQTVFAKLLASADAMYPEVDRVVETLERQVPPAHDSLRKWEVKHAGGGDSKFLSLEMASTEEVPFVRSDVHRAVRYSLGGKDPHMRNYGVESFGMSSNSLLGKTHASSTSDLWSGTHRLRFASKYFVEETRSIFVTVVCIDSVNASGEPVDGFVLKEQKWTILTSQAAERDHPSDSKAEATQIQTLSVITFEFLHPSLSSLWCEDVVETAVIPAWDSAVSAAQQRLENVLLDQIRG